MTGRDPSDPDASPTEDEVRESERLREALEDPRKDHHPDADLLRAVKNAAAPSALDPKALDAAVERGLAGGRRTRASGLVIRVVFGAGALMAAAAIIILVGRMPEPSPPELVHARSTQPLFSERFESHGGESARIDRIAVARAADLRENHFARWGVGSQERRGRR